MNQSSFCPCGSNQVLSACCGRWHRGEAAHTPEQLMRSRYSAFVLRNDKYLLETWHARTRPVSVAFEPRQKWLGLKIIEAPDPKNMKDANEAEVEFIARYRVGGATAERLHERSRFVKENDRWFYVDGKLG